MDAHRFDRLVKSFSASGTRRGVVGLLAALPLAGGFAALLDEESEAGRRRRRKARHRRRAGNRKQNRKGKRKGKDKGKDKNKGCTPGTCPPNACGSLPDGCGGTLACACAGNQICDNGTCQVCNVVCPNPPCHNVVQAEIDAVPPLETIYVCPGLYTDDDSVTIGRNLTLIGAGAGTDPQIHTILDGEQTPDGFPVVFVFNISDPVVQLRDLTVRGGDGGIFGGGIRNQSALTLEGVLVTQNSSGAGGGIHNEVGDDATLTLNAGTQVTGNTADSAPEQGGGVYNSQDGTVTLNAGSSVTGNTAAEGADIYNLGTVIDQGGVVGECFDEPGFGTGCPT